MKFTVQLDIYFSDEQIERLKSLPYIDGPEDIFETQIDFCLEGFLENLSWDVYKRTDIDEELGFESKLLSIQEHTA